MFPDNVLGLLLFLGGGFTLPRGGGSSSCTSSGLFGNWLSVVGFIPLSERSGVDLDDGTLYEGVRTDEFVVRGVVDNRDDTGLACDSFGAPRKVASI